MIDGRKANKCNNMISRRTQLMMHAMANKHRGNLLCNELTQAVQMWSTATLCYQRWMAALSTTPFSSIMVGGCQDSMLNSKDLLHWRCYVCCSAPSSVDMSSPVNIPFLGWIVQLNYI